MVRREARTHMATDGTSSATVGEKERPTRVAWRAACGAGVAELLGTALLVLGCCLPRPASRALAAGIVVASLVQCFDHVSGAMLNPAMSLAGAMLGRVSWRRAALYSIAQVAGGTLGALLLSYITGVEYCSTCVTLLGTERGAGVSAVQGVAVEAVLTGCLALANAAAWDRRAPSGDSWPLRLGTTVAALSLVGGELTGASMNPARSFGPALWAQNFTHHWVYWAGPLLGAAGGSLLYNVLWALPRTPQPSLTPAPGTAPLVNVACS